MGCSMKWNENRNIAANTHTHTQLLNWKRCKAIETDNDNDNTNESNDQVDERTLNAEMVVIEPKSSNQIKYSCERHCLSIVICRGKLYDVFFSWSASLVYVSIKTSTAIPIQSNGANGTGAQENEKSNSIDRPQSVYRKLAHTNCAERDSFCYGASTSPPPPSLSPFLSLPSSWHHWALRSFDVAIRPTSLTHSIRSIYRR